jgi:hypothetical protein
MPHDRRAGELPADQITLLWSAFDATWSAIKDRYTGSEQYADAGRLRLAKRCLPVYAPVSPMPKYSTSMLSHRCGDNLPVRLPSSSSVHTCAVLSGNRPRDLPSFFGSAQLENYAGPASS